MKERKLKFNSKARPNSSESYIKEPSVIEGSDGYRRLVFGLYSRLQKDDSDVLKETLDAHCDDRSVIFTLDKEYPAVEFDEKSGTAEFTSAGKQYKIRALQEDDKSWIINFKLPEGEKNS